MSESGGSIICEDKCAPQLFPSQARDQPLKNWPGNTQRRFSYIGPKSHGCSVSKNCRLMREGQKGRRTPKTECRKVAAPPFVRICTNQIPSTSLVAQYQITQVEERISRARFPPKWPITAISIQCFSVVSRYYFGHLSNQKNVSFRGNKIPCSENGISLRSECIPALPFRWI